MVDSRTGAGAGTGTVPKSYKDELKITKFSTKNKQTKNTRGFIPSLGHFGHQYKVSNGLNPLNEQRLHEWLIDRRRGRVLYNRTTNKYRTKESDNHHL